MAAILIAEDEPRISAFVEKGLRAAGFATSVARDGRGALEHAASGEFDLMILDLGLPGLDGLGVLEALRGQGSILPVIILTARDSVTDTVAGLEGGADDYMAKPFRFEELLARVRLRLRDRTQESPAVLAVNGLSLDVRTRMATVDGVPVELSNREFTLLETFLAAPGPGTQPGAAAVAGLGVRLRPGLERRRRVRALSAQQDRQRPDRHRPGRRVPLHALTPEHRSMVHRRISIPGGDPVADPAVCGSSGRTR